MSTRAFTPADAPPPSPALPLVPKLCAPGRTCRLRLSFSIFFDGTRNHLREDEPDGSHSNVARLFKAAHEEQSNGIYRLYVQGVGTPFPEIGEREPHPDGAKAGTMGAERIRYAFLYIANEVSRKLSRRLIVPDTPRHIAAAVKDDSQLDNWKRQLTFMLSGSENPKVDEIVFDVFGFSRGAAAARSFVNQLKHHFCQAADLYCGVPMRIRFMGLFDTVASVGYADSFPGPVNGHQDWGDESLLTIPDDVEHCVHLVAAHEARNSFPVDLTRKQHTYSSNCVEIIYPGVHSDVGGGYGLYTQGKGSRLADGRIGRTQADKLSQIALNDMYERALAKGVPLRSRERLITARLDGEFAIRPELQAAFDRYMSAVAAEGKGWSAEKQMLRHRSLHLGWRKQVLDRFETLPFVQQSGGQDKNDLIEANKELIATLRACADQPARVLAHARSGRDSPAPPPPPGYEFLEDWNRAPSPSRDVSAFFECYVHDSRAHFLLTDPQSERDHRNIHRQLEDIDSRYQRDLRAHRDIVERVAAGPNRNRYVFIGNTPSPRDPLSGRQRSILELYRAGKYPLYSDRHPASSTDGTVNAVDAVNLYGGRREPKWTYLHKRQVFAYSRVTY
ncbi:MAG: DUF2235 domain-containing protein [Proteobacteria bacterium]|nr:DUF2235 domain-containing protein [Pseudomonadota bacterium]